jgi:MoaA/NifB/PqqE/SkfB family radical SAM enzyme
MEFWQRIHYFTTDKCNEQCRYCFKPNFAKGQFENHDQEILPQLVLNGGGVKQIIYTGGEPLIFDFLKGGLWNSLGYLMGHGVDTSVHTNAMYLNKSNLKALSSLTNEIAIPIDSMDSGLQANLRRIDCLDHVLGVFDQLQGKGVRIGIHSVFTDLNRNEMPKIYEFLSKHNFDYWRIYEFNPEIVPGRFNSVDHILDVEELVGPRSSEEDGGVNTLYAKFLLAEEEMLQFNDPRIEFVGVKDMCREPYIFMYPNGDTEFSSWALEGKRIPTGNILKLGFNKIKQDIIDGYNSGTFVPSEIFFEAVGDRELFVRYAYEGNYDSEELEGIDCKTYAQRFLHLANLHFNRLKRMGYLAQSEEPDFEFV